MPRQKDVERRNRIAAQMLAAMLVCVTEFKSVKGLIELGFTPMEARAKIAYEYADALIAEGEKKEAAA